jgi:transposase
VLYGARYSPHYNRVERIWAALKNYMANTAVSWPGRLRQIHSFCRARHVGGICSPQPQIMNDT